MKKIQLYILVKSIGLYLNCLSYINAEKAKSSAYKLFSQPRKGKLTKEKMPKTLQSAEQETFQYQNENIQTYIWRGNEDIILLIHGWESNSSRWKKLLHHIKPLGKTIIAIDGPAHGLSGGKEFNAPKYAEFIQVVSQKYQPKIIIGHSIGGAAITYYLHKFKNPQVEKIILLGSPSDLKIFSDNFVTLLGLNNKIKTKLEEFYFEKFNFHIGDFSGHLFSEHFFQKAFIAHDTHDKVVLVEEGRKYAKSWKNSTYIETSDLGHSMHDADLYQQIVRFIAEA